MQTFRFEITDSIVRRIIKVKATDMFGAIHELVTLVDEKYPGYRPIMRQIDGVMTFFR